MKTYEVCFDDSKSVYNILINKVMPQDFASQDLKVQDIGMRRYYSFNRRMHNQRQV